MGLRTASRSLRNSVASLRGSTVLRRAGSRWNAVGLVWGLGLPSFFVLFFSRRRRRAGGRAGRKTFNNDQSRFVFSARKRDLQGPAPYPTRTCSRVSDQPGGWKRWKGVPFVRCLSVQQICYQLVIAHADRNKCLCVAQQSLSERKTYKL